MGERQPVAWNCGLEQIAHHSDGRVARLAYEANEELNRLRAAAQVVLDFHAPDYRPDNSISRPLLQLREAMRAGRSDG